MSRFGTRCFLGDWLRSRGVFGKVRGGTRLVVEYIQSGLLGRFQVEIVTGGTRRLGGASDLPFLGETGWSVFHRLK